MKSLPISENSADPSEALNHVRFRASGREIMTSKPSYFEGLAEEVFLFGGHLTRSGPRPFMLIPTKVKDAVDHQEDDHSHAVQLEPLRLALRCFYRNDKISQEVRVKGRKFSLAHREGKDIGGPVAAEMASIQLPDPGVIDQEDAQLCLRKSQGHQDPTRCPSYFS